MKRVSGKEALQNHAQAAEPKNRVKERPAGEARGSDVGGEKKANVKGAQLGGSKAEAGKNPLGRAVGELHSQHPIKHHEHGPHHGTDHHHRHEPLHGLGAGKKKHHEEHGG